MAPRKQTDTSRQPPARPVRTPPSLWDSAAWKTPYREDLAEDDKVAGLSLFWSEVKYNFVFADRLAQLDWDARYKEYVPRVRRTRGTYEYYRALQELCAILQDGHTGVVPPPQILNDYYALPRLRVALVEGMVLLVDVPDDALRREGLEVGQAVIAVDGLPVHTYVQQQVLPYLGDSTPQAREWHAYSMLLAGPRARPAALTLRDARGRTLEKSVRRDATPMDLFRPDPLFDLRTFDGGVACVSLNSFMEEGAARSFEAALPEIRKAQALIIDLRRNGGGNGSVGFSILAHLTDRDFPTSRWETRLYNPTFRAWGRTQETFVAVEEHHVRPDPAATPYRKPVAVLTGAQTGSAAEDFCVAFDTLRRGTLVGEPTNGSTGQPLRFDLPGGGSAYVCTKHDSYPDGREFVGVGVRPDVLVRPTVTDVRAGRDTVLEAALALLRPQ